MSPFLPSGQHMVFDPRLGFTILHEHDQPYDVNTTSDGGTPSTCFSTLVNSLSNSLSTCFHSPAIFCEPNSGLAFNPLSISTALDISSVTHQPALGHSRSALLCSEPALGHSRFTLGQPSGLRPQLALGDAPNTSRPSRRSITNLQHLCSSTHSYYQYLRDVSIQP